MIKIFERTVSIQSAPTKIHHLPKNETSRGSHPSKRVHSDYSGQRWLYHSNQRRWQGWIDCCAQKYGVTENTRERDHRNEIDPENRVRDVLEGVDARRFSVEKGEE